MYLTDINKIEIILKENAQAKNNALKFFEQTMSTKYGVSRTNIHQKMNDTEKDIYSKAYADKMDSIEVYNSFIHNDWR